MRAEEVLRRYADGERDFRGANLCGANFKGQDLSGADLSGADIRSANFSNATLRGVNFTEAQAGLRRKWMVVHFATIVVVSAIAGILDGAENAFLFAFISSPNFNSLYQQAAASLIYTLLLSVVDIVILLRGFSIQAKSLITYALVILFISIVTGALAVVGSIVLEVSSVFLLAVTVAVAVEIGGMPAIAIAVVGVLVGAFGSAERFSGTVPSVSIDLLFSFYICWRMLKEDRNFEIVRTIALALSKIGGTTFYSSTLIGATFSEGKLRSTNFGNIHL